MRYEIKFKVREKFAKDYRKGICRFSKLDSLAEFIEWMEKKYEYCEFEKYDNGQLVSCFVAYKHNFMPSLHSIDFKNMRKAKGLTLREVEERTGISNAYLSQLETGKIKSPGYDTVKALYELYSNGR